LLAIFSNVYYGVRETKCFKRKTNSALFLRRASHLHEPHALGVSLEREVEAPEPIPRKGVRPTLQHNRPRLKHVHDLCNGKKEKRKKKKHSACTHAFEIYVVQKKKSEVILEVKTRRNISKWTFLAYSFTAQPLHSSYVLHVRIANGIKVDKNSFSIPSTFWSTG